MQKNFDKSKIEKFSIFFVIQFLFFILYHNETANFSKPDREYGNHRKHHKGELR